VYLEKSIASDQTDAQSWYLLGRCYMSQQKYPKAYKAYQQAVYRDGRKPYFLVQHRCVVLSDQPIP
jgi:glucose repression mediator protein